MGVYINGKRMSPPYINGKKHNAYINGKKIWISFVPPVTWIKPDSNGDVNLTGYCEYFDYGTDFGQCELLYVSYKVYNSTGGLVQRYTDVEVFSPIINIGVGNYLEFDGCECVV